MRDISKAMLRFSWAMPLFGFQQMINLLDPRGQGRAAEALDALSRAADEQLNDWVRTMYRTGDAAQSQLVDGLFGGGAAPGAASGAGAPARAQLTRLTGSQNYKADPQREAVIARYTRGTGQFSRDKKYIALRMTMYTLDGREDGYHEGVWEAQFKDPRELLARPAPPTGPMDEPVGPVPHAPIMAQTKARWVFKDRGSIIVAGPATSHLIPLRDGSFLFLVSTAQVITGGTGQFEGAYGLVQSLGATHVPAGVNLFGEQDVSFTAMTMDTFKVVPARNVASRPAPQTQTQTQTQQQPPARPVTQMAAAAAPSPDYPFEPHYVEVHGSRMHYVDEGAGDPVLFLHGNPAWSYLWRNVIPHLRSSNRCIAPDLIGMGRSDKPEIRYTFSEQAKYLEGFIKKLRLRRVVVVMHDWGTALGFHYAMRNEGNVRGVAFMEALLKPYESWDDFPASLRDTFRAFRDPVKGRELIVEENAMIERVLPASVMRRLSEREMNYYREPFREPSSREPIWKFIGSLPIGGSPPDVARLVASYSARLRRSNLPKLLIYAEPGAITSAADVSWCHQNLKNFQAVNIGPGIHFHQEDNPDAVGRELAAWCRQVSPEGRPRQS